MIARLRCGCDGWELFGEPHGPARWVGDYPEQAAATLRVFGLEPPTLGELAEVAAQRRDIWYDVPERVLIPWEEE